MSAEPGASATTELSHDAATQVLFDYVWAVDRKDLDGVRAQLTSGVRARYGGERPWLEGADAVLRMLGAAIAPVAWQQHAITVESVRVEGGAATVRATLAAYQTMTQDPATLVTMLGRYHARLDGGTGRWLVAELDLDLGWVERRTAAR